MCFVEYWRSMSIWLNILLLSDNSWKNNNISPIKFRAENLTESQQRGRSAKVIYETNLGRLFHFSGAYMLNVISPGFENDLPGTWRCRPCDQRHPLGLWADSVSKMYCGVRAACAKLRGGFWIVFWKQQKTLRKPLILEMFELERGNLCDATGIIETEFTTHH